MDLEHKTPRDVFNTVKKYCDLLLSNLMIKDICQLPTSIRDLDDYY